MEISGKNYAVDHQSGTSTVSFRGTLRFREISDYDSIEQLLHRVADENPDGITLDLQQLEYLNSSGITAISMFIYKLNERHQQIQPTIKISKKYSWQSRLLKNLTQIVSTLQFEQVD